MTMTLVIGNKNLSSWSLRPWLLLRHFDLPFEEQLVRLSQPSFRTEIKAHSPSGMVPSLKAEGVDVWDSLAIAEYLAEAYPEKPFWPSDRMARARARCIASEMHSGFSTIRTVWPMDVMSVGRQVTCPYGVRKDLMRIFSLWEDARAEYGAGGDFLFGEFGIVDALFAPVVFRIRTYGPVGMPTVCERYMSAMLELPAMKVWEQGAKAEVDAGWYSHSIMDTPV